MVLRGFKGPARSTNRARDPLEAHYSQFAEAVVFQRDWLWNLQQRCVHIANRNHKAELNQAAKNAGCEVRAIRIIAEILGKLLFIAVRGREARLNGDPTHDDYPQKLYTSIM
jgi:hypothetical protein